MLSCLLIAQAVATTCDVSKGRVDVKVTATWKVTCNGEEKEQNLVSPLILTGATEKNAVVIYIGGNKNLEIVLEKGLEFNGLGEACFQIEANSVTAPKASVTIRCNDVRLATNGFDIFDLKSDIPVTFVAEDVSTQPTVSFSCGSKRFASKGVWSVDGCKFIGDGIFAATSLTLTGCVVTSESGSMSAGDISISECTIDMKSTSGASIGGTGRISIFNSNITVSTTEGPGIGQCETIYLFNSKISVESTSGSAIGDMNSGTSKISIYDCEISAKGSMRGIGTTTSLESIAVINSKLEISSTQTGIGSCSDMTIISSTVAVSTTTGVAVGNGQGEMYMLSIISSTIDASSDANTGIGSETSHIVDLFVDRSTVTVSVSGKGSAIGGLDSSIDSLRIRGSEIRCEAGQSTGIGGGSKIGQLVLSECKVINSTGGGDGAGIGGTKIGLLKIDRCTVYASAIGGSGIGSTHTTGNAGVVAIPEILITNSRVTARSGANHPAIGGVSVHDGNFITIRLVDSDIDAFSGYFDRKTVCFSAGIGGSGHTSNLWSGSIVIEHCTVRAVSGYTSMGAGIGGGRNGYGDVTIIDSDVVSISSLDPALDLEVGGSGIGYGGISSNNSLYGDAQGKGHVAIKGSRVSAFGSNVKVGSGNVALAGSGIGFGGVNKEISYGRLDQFPALNVTIEDSVVYAFGGNNSVAGGKCGAAVMGGDDKGYSGDNVNLGRLELTNSVLYAFGAHVTESVEDGCAIGPSVYHKNGKLYGTLQMRNSSLIVQHHPDDGAFFPVLMNTVTVDSDCRLSLSSTSDSLFPEAVVNDIQVPVIVLRKVNALGVNSISVYDTSDIFVGSELVYEQDVAVGISVPSPGSYSVRATREGKLHHVHESSSNGDLRLSVEAPGMKVFTDLKLTIYEGGGGSDSGSDGTDSDGGSGGTGSEGGSTDGSDGDDKDKKKKVTIALSVVVVVCVIVAVVVIVIVLIKKKKNGHHVIHSDETESVAETAESFGP